MVDFPPLPTICVPQIPTQGTTTPGAMSQKFASLFGVEQADIDQMNSPGACPGGSPYAAPLLGAFNRDGNFLETVLNPNKSQSGGDLFDGNEASLRLDYNPARIIASSVSSIGPDPRTNTAAETPFAVSSAR